MDILFANLERLQPDHIAVRQYKVFQQAAGRTAKSIIVSAAVRIAAFSIDGIRRITDHDEMDISAIGEEKTALFAIIPDSDKSLNYLVSMLFMTAIQELYYQADRVHGGRLPIPVHLIWDEHCNTAVEDTPSYLSTMRSRGIFASIVIQNLAQIKALYKDSWETLTGNADTLLYLGGNEESTHKYISGLLGKESFISESSSQSHGMHGSYSKSRQSAGRELMTPDEVRLLDNAKSLLFIRGQRPVLDDKYDLMAHPNVSHTEAGGFMPYQHKKPIRFPGTPLLDAIDFSRVEDYEII